MSRPLVYIAHPLSGDWEANIAQARRWVAAAFRAGFYPVAPYLMCVDVLHEPEDRALGLEYDLAFLEMVDALWLCGPRVSEGMAAEAARAAEIGVKTLRLIDPADLESLAEKGDA
jgi:hypothetical protein